MGENSGACFCIRILTLVRLRLSCLYRGGEAEELSGRCWIALKYSSNMEKIQSSMLSNYGVLDRVLNNEAMHAILHKNFSRVLETYYK